MGQVKGVFYARYMDGWIVLTKSKTALRIVIKKTHDVMNGVKFQLHPTKTYIGKISNGFNFLAFYMDLEKILPATETIRRALERVAALYESSPKKNVSHRHKRTTSDRDISEYHVNEPAPTNEFFTNTLNHLLSLAASKPDILGVMRRYIGQWARWTKIGLSTIKDFEHYVQVFLPDIFSLWMSRAKR
jgi:hypothetical protein